LRFLSYHANEAELLNGLSAAGRDQDGDARALKCDVTVDVHTASDSSVINKTTKVAVFVADHRAQQGRGEKSCRKL
jgi:hypothetical protein